MSFVMKGKNTEISTGALIERERKANGMSRRQLAFRLGVHRSLVKFWETGRQTPSLRMLSLLSETLDISPEELMHGERDPQRQGSNMSFEKGRRARRVMAVSLGHFRRANFVNIGIAVLGMVAGLVLNLVFRRAWLAFAVNMAATLAGCAGEGVALWKAAKAVDRDSLEEKHIALYKASLLRLGMGAYTVAGLFIGWSFPMLICVDDAVSGLSAEKTFMYGILWGAVAFFLAVAICFVLHGKWIKWGRIPLSERDREIYFWNHRLMWVITLIFIVLLGCSIYGEWWLTRPRRLLKEISFYDRDSFVEYMEKDLRYPYDGSREKNMFVFYCNRRGEPISETEALRTVLRDRKGNVITSYLDRNRNVYDIETGDGEGDPYPIRVSTYTAMRDAKRDEVMIHTAFAFIYAVEMLSAVLIYLRKRKEH